MAWWSLIKVGADKGIGNMQEQHAGDNAAMESNAQARDPRMTYATTDRPYQGDGLKTAQTVDRMAGWGDGSVKMNPLMSQPAEMEKNVGNAPTALGAFAQQPTTTNSAQPSYQQSGGLRDYMNYLRYGRY